MSEEAEDWTPGPWERCGAARGGCQCGQVWSKTADCVVLTVEFAYENRMDKAPPVAEAKANARLAATSTELYNVLKSLVKLIDDVDHSVDGEETDRVFASYEFDAARAILKKARTK